MIHPNQRRPELCRRHPSLVMIESLASGPPQSMIRSLAANFALRLTPKISSSTIFFSFDFSYLLIPIFHRFHQSDWCPSTTLTRLSSAVATRWQIHFDQQNNSRLDEFMEEIEKDFEERPVLVSKQPNLTFDLSHLFKVVHIGLIWRVVFFPAIRTNPGRRDHLQRARIQGKANTFHFYFVGCLIGSLSWRHTHT